MQALVRVLDQKCLEYKVDSKSCVDVFGSFEVTDLVLSLEKEGCKVFSMVERVRESGKLLHQSDGR